MLEQISAFDILSTLFSLGAVVISYMCYKNAKRETFINAYSSYRISWISEIRSLTNEFINYKRKNKHEKMVEYKYKIDMYLNFKYLDHKQYSDLLDSAIMDEVSIEEIIMLSQQLIDNYWRKTKTEAYMNPKTNRKIRKETYGEGNLYD